MKAPFACSNLQEIRAEIDEIDHRIIAALGERFGYVKAAARFKPDAASVSAPERVAAMMQQRRLWAEEEGLSPDVIEGLFRELVAYFTDQEVHHFRQTKQALP